MRNTSPSVLVAVLLNAIASLHSASAKLGMNHLRDTPKKRSLHESKLPRTLPKSLDGLQDKGVPISEYAKQEQDNNNPNTKIVGGGTVSGPEVYPFFVSWGDYCGGSLIYPDIVLTAAHCIEVLALTDEVTVGAYEVGNPNTQGAVSRSVTDFAIHPQYTSNNFSNDFLLLKLNATVDSIEPVQLNDALSVPQDNQDLTVIGLGVLTEGGFQPNKLQEVTVQAVSDAECQANYDGIIVEDVMVCAGVDGGGKDSCQGDSGGPIFSLTASGEIDKQIGVVSWGFGCAQPDLPGVYAEISAVNEWISTQICALSDDTPEECPEPPPMPVPTPPGEGEVTVVVTLLTDSYPAEIGWSLADDTGTELAGVEEGWLTQSFQLISTPINLEIGREYTFTITDSFGDGLLSPGFYEVTAGDLVLASGGTGYGESESTPFTAPGNQESTPAPTPAGTPVQSGTVSPATPAPTPVHSSTPPPAGPITDCVDTSGTIYVDSEAGDQTCEWLGVNTERYFYLCQFVDVAVACPFTCDWCSVFA